MVNETIPVPFVGIRLTTARDLSQGRMPVYHKKQDVQARFSLQKPNPIPLQKYNFRGKEDQHQNQQELNQENHRHADAEGRLSCLVVEEIHGENAPDAAADDGLQEQDRLGRPPFAAACLFLIQPHRLEGNQVDCKKIDQQQNSGIDMKSRKLLQKVIERRHEGQDPFRKKTVSI